MKTSGKKLSKALPSVPEFLKQAQMYANGETQDFGQVLEEISPLFDAQEAEIEKNRVRGPGGAPTRATTLPIDPASRKNFPIASGVLDYFPDAIVAISEISKAGNDQHNPGLPMRWTRAKSGDEADTCIRHFLQRGTLDTDGKRHTAKAAWRLLALLQKEIEAEQNNNRSAK